MSDAVPPTVTSPTTTPLTFLGGADALVCTDDACFIPAAPAPAASPAEGGGAGARAVQPRDPA